MFDNLAAYYHENVVTEFIDYRDTSKDGVAGRSRDLRRALVAATALFHLREHLPTPSVASRGNVEHQCPDYALLGDVVNSAKHKEITQNTPHGAPLVNQAASLSERHVLIEYNDACGSYRHALKTVIVKLADGSERNLLEVMTNVINHWESRLHTLGVLTSARVFSYEDPNRLRTRSECNGGLLDLEVDRGQRFLQRMQLLRFNETTGKAEPVDLTGATIHGVIFKPSYEFEVSLSHDATGKKFKKSVLLTESESMDLHALSTDAEREAFALATQTAKDALHELAVAVGLQQSSDSTGNGEHVE